jgi:hypothetical protein
MADMRAAAWIAVSAALMMTGCALVGLAITAAGMASNPEFTLTSFHAVAVRLAVGVIVVGGLLPQIVLTGLLWLAVMRLAPGLERSWFRVCGTAVALSLAAFPVIALTTFTMWEPETAADYANTLALMSGTTAAALLIPRRWIRRFGPGAIAGPGGRATSTRPDC